MRAKQNLQTEFQNWWKSLREFRYYFRKYRTYYLFGIFSLIVVDSLEAFPPLLLKSAVDALSSKISFIEIQSTLLKIVVLYLLIAGTQGLMRYFWRKYIIRTSMLASNDMRQDLFVHLSSLAPGFFQKHRVGDLVSLASNDIEAIRFSLGPGALVFFDALFYFIAIPPIMLWISPKLTLIAFVPMFLVPFFVRRMEGKIQKHFREVQDRFSLLASNCQEAMSGIRVIKSSSLEKFKEKEFLRLSADYADSNMKAVSTQATLTAGLEGIISLSTSLLFIAGGYLVVKQEITLGVFVAFQRYIQKMAWPMEAFGMAANIFQKSVASQSRIDETKTVQPEFLPKKNALKLSKDIPVLEARYLQYRHAGSSGESFQLQDISFQIPARMKVGIVGEVGSGKSTLLHCLAGTKKVEKGQLFFDGHDSDDLSIQTIREKIGFVPQEGFLFSRSIEENILYGSSLFFSGDANLRKNASIEAARAAQIETEINRFPEGFETTLGERGVDLSGGQRQRLTIARAFAKKPSVLILDDCLSAVDAETEQALLREILKAAEGITLIMASQRRSSFQNMDWVIFLKNGKIAAQGTPKGLFISNEQYKNFWSHNEVETRP